RTTSLDFRRPITDGPTLHSCCRYTHPARRPRGGLPGPNAVAIPSAAARPPANLPFHHFPGTIMAPTLMSLWSREFESRPAVFIPDGLEVTYGQLQRQVEAVTAGLRAGGVKAGEPIAIVLPNNLEFLVTFLATTCARAVAAPLNPGYKVEEFRFYLEDAGAR